MSDSKATLYTYWRSSCSWRVRIALAWKGVDYESIPVHLVKDGGEQLKDEYSAKNPMKEVPTLEIDGLVLTQSLAIIEYIEETRPERPLLPGDPAERHRVRELSQIIATGIQPVQNLRVLKKHGMEQKGEWGRWAINHGFAALEAALSKTAGKYCFGDQVTIADLCLIPQVYNANRFAVDMSLYPTISRVASELESLTEFQSAHPSAQPDAE